jgi:hypothetical protein
MCLCSTSRKDRPQLLGEFFWLVHYHIMAALKVSVFQPFALACS